MNTPKPKATKTVVTIAALKAQNAELTNQIDQLTIDQVAAFQALQPGPEQTLKDILPLAQARMAELETLRTQTKGTP